MDSKAMYTVRMPYKLKKQLEDITERLNKAEPDRQYKYSQNSIIIEALEIYLKKKDKELKKKGF